MVFVHLVIGAALIEFLYFGFAVGKAREKYGIKAPATTGNEMFERYYRVQVNTLEQLIVFIPSIFLFARYIEPRVAAIAGAMFVIGRAWYFSQYVRDPSKRSLGIRASFLPMRSCSLAPWAAPSCALSGSARAAAGGRSRQGSKERQ